MSEERATYEPRAIESKWQAVWAEEKTWEVANPGQPGFEADKPKAYVLEMLPYPSGEPHVGHLKCYAVGEGTLWIAWPKRSSGVETDITEDVVREIALPAGLVDTKVCAIDATWSGLRLTKRRS